mmetsp:Transcript_39255/g.76180  ORF Transcript_39255/g.76180 Transcript_39255/m.76180 type:complete len:223 (-) Transcript_39255:131-799(-)
METVRSFVTRGVKETWVPRSVMPHLVGTQGRNINRLRTEHNTQLRFPSDKTLDKVPVTVSGDPKAVDAVIDEIRGLIESYGTPSPSPRHVAKEECEYSEWSEEDHDDGKYDGGDDGGYIEDGDDDDYYGNDYPDGEEEEDESEGPPGDVDECHFSPSASGHLSESFGGSPPLSSFSPYGHISSPVSLRYSMASSGYSTHDPCEWEDTPEGSPWSSPLYIPTP